MPELPEVESVRRGLEPVLCGRRLADVLIHDDRLTRPMAGADIAHRIVGARVIGTRRRGKYLLLELDTGDTIEHHLRMTGSFAVDAEVSHERLRYVLDDGVVVRYNDPRRFGTMVVDRSSVIGGRLDTRLGPEPLSDDFTPGVLHAVLRRRRAPVKAILLDQRAIAGIGNIYADESLALARINPATPGTDISRPAARRLHGAIVERLNTAIRVGGSTLRDYRGVAGEVGGMAERFVAYGRAGEPCDSCGAAMVGGVVAGRGSTWCPRCQRRRPG